MNIELPDNQTFTTHRHTSELLTEIIQSQKNDTVTVESLSIAIEQRSFGGVILLLAIVGLIPGISVFAGAAIFILALQIMAGLETPRLPKFIASRELVVSHLKKTMSFPIRQLRKLERVVKPRWSILTSTKAFRASRIIIAILALVMITPFPLSNLLPAVALLFIAMGLLEDDGLLIFIGLVSSIFALALGAIMLDLVYRVASLHIFSR